MLLLQANHVEKSYGDRLILSFDTLQFYRGDKIGIVGPNGAGKTTLLNILSGLEQADTGEIQSYGTMAFIAQEGIGVTGRLGGARQAAQLNVLEQDTQKGELQEVSVLDRIDGIDQAELERRKKRFSKELGLVQHELNIDYLSGGEETKLKLAKAFGVKGDILFADEPTSHLDLEGIQYLEQHCQAHQGAIILVSHDRRFLDQVCTKILEIEDGKLTEYIGNYTAYKEQKERQILIQQQEYEKYIKEKKRLTEAIVERTDRAKSIKKAPKRMGNSEARLHKRKAFEKQEKIENAQKAIETRLAKLEKKEKPKETPQIHMELQQSLKLHAKYAIRVEHLNKAVGDRELFCDVSFHLRTGSKLALVGPNGCGKSTLLKMILEQEKDITVAQGVKFGYFSQRLEELNAEQTILKYVMEHSTQPEDVVRTVLARMGFERDSVYKVIGNLSGGEKVKVSLAKLLAGNYNVLVLDEPTNFLDLYALEALEELLTAYQGTLLFVTHDREFVDRVASHVLVFQEQGTHFFAGTYAQFLEAQQKKAEAPRQDIQEQILLAENRIQQLIGRLSMPLPSDNPTELEQEYQLALATLKQLRNHT